MAYRFEEARKRQIIESMTEDELWMYYQIGGRLTEKQLKIVAERLQREKRLRRDVESVASEAVA